MHDEDISAVAISPHGRWVASGQCGSSHIRGFPAFVVVWDLSTTQPLLLLEGLTRRVNTLCFSPDSRFLMASSEDALLFVWDMTSGLPSAISGFRGGELVFSQRYPTPLEVCFWGSVDMTPSNNNQESGNILSHGGSLARGMSSKHRREDYYVIKGSNSNVCMKDLLLMPFIADYIPIYYPLPSYVYYVMFFFNYQFIVYVIYFFDG